MNLDDKRGKATGGRDWMFEKRKKISDGVNKRKRSSTAFSLSQGTRGG